MLKSGFTTMEVVELLHTKEHIVRYAIRNRKVRPPQKLATGDLLWTPAEIRDLARALALPVPQIPVDDREDPAAGAAGGAGGGEPGMRITQQDTP